MAQGFKLLLGMYASQMSATSCPSCLAPNQIPDNVPRKVADEHVLGFLLILMEFLSHGFGLTQP